MTAGGARPSAARTSLLIATYNWKEALALVLASVRAQVELPGEVVIADDGSRDDTRERIAREARTFPVPLRHIWHPDSGFRLAEIRNKSMAAAAGDYLIQIDGDLVLHPSFVRGHLRAARPGYYVQGSRAMLDAGRTARCLATGDILLSAWSAGVHQRINALYLPAFARVVRGPTDAMTRTRGANMAFWRDDILRVNGYDESMDGWGREDNELVARLIHSGVRRRNLKFSAVAWHLHHAMQSQAQVTRNDEVLARTLRERRVWCDRGIAQHLTDASGAPA